MLSIKSAIATNRFGLGARPGDSLSIGRDGEDWLAQQIEYDAPPLNGDQSASAATLERIGELRLARQVAQARVANQAVEVDRNAIREYARFIGQTYQAQASLALTAAIESERPFHERLVLFWENHFSVSADKQPVGALVTTYRDEAIRPHVTGNFREMVKAVVRHPAMLLYLDNQTSIGPNSSLGRLANRTANRRTGLNENLAREILELHTLGVDGGYSQNDVVEFSKSLTGWSIGGQGPAQANNRRMGGIARRLGIEPADEKPGEFTFRPALHEPGGKTILGRRFAEGDVDEAEAVLDFLAAQPATARFIATKLARHFVADEPPVPLVDRLTDIYLENDAELVPVYRALIGAKESWAEPLAKFKTPQDFLISAFRAIGTVPNARDLVGVATQLGQRPMTPGSPAGWPDTAEHWSSGEALMKRIEWSTAAGAGIGDRIDAVARLDEVLGEVASESTRKAIHSAESGAQAMALLFSAPEFQRR